eukprot:2283621-Karenia_brevis.AAC.1
MPEDAAATLQTALKALQQLQQASPPAHDHSDANMDVGDSTHDDELYASVALPHFDNAFSSSSPLGSKDARRNDGHTDRQPKSPRTALGKGAQTPPSLPPPPPQRNPTPSDELDQRP